MRRQTERWLRWAPPLAVGVALALVVAYGVVGPRQSASPSGWAEVFEAVSPSVLLVSIEAPESRVGTAFAVSATEAVTARHLVIGASTVLLTDPYGATREAEVIGTDARTDLALLRVEGGLPTVDLGSTENLRVGDPVVTIGNPYGLGHSLATGVVSHRGRRLAAGTDGPRVDFIQLSISLSPGNSGGPIFDASGRVVAVLAGTHTQGQAIAFAVPVESVSSGLEGLRGGNHISRAFLGLRAVTVDRALVVESVVASGPADRAGIRPGDALTAVAGVTLSTPDALTSLLDDLPGGRRITVRMLRDGKVEVADVVLGDWAEQPVAVAGMTIRANPGSGGVVVAVRPRSRAERAGIRVGDTVRTVNGLPVQAPVDVRTALGGGGDATMEIEREGVAMPAHLDG